MADAISTPLEKKKKKKKKSLVKYKTNKEDSTVLCRAIRTWGKTLYFSLHFFHALQLPACFTTEQKHKWKFGRRNLVGGEILWEHNSPKLQTSMLGFL